MNWISWLSILWAIVKGLLGKEERLEFDWGENEDKEIEEELKYPIEEKEEEFGRFLWILDNGHGKLTRGKRSPHINEKGDRLYEYEFNRDIVERIIARIDPMGFHYFDLVDDYMERGNFLKGRVDRANNILSPMPKVYVSIHANAGPVINRDAWSTANGVETWYKKGSMLGAELAEIFQKHIVAQTGWRDRGIKFKKIKREEFYVLKRTDMVAVLTENGFYNNRVECDMLMREEVRQAIADAHVEAMMEIERVQLINEDEIS